MKISKTIAVIPATFNHWRLFIMDERAKAEIRKSFFRIDTGESGLVIDDEYYFPVLGAEDLRGRLIDDYVVVGDHNETTWPKIQKARACLLPNTQSRGG